MSQLAGAAFASLLLFAAMPALSADEPTLDQQIQMVRSQTEAQRQATVAANVVLNGEESDKFWPVYRDYRNDVAKLSDERVALIREFADNYGSLTDDKAKSLIKRSLDNQKARISLKSKYVGKFEKVLPATKAARVMQIENKLDALIELALAATIPLAIPSPS